MWNELGERGVNGAKRNCSREAAASLREIRAEAAEKLCREKIRVWKEREAERSQRRLLPLSSTTSTNLSSDFCPCSHP